MFLPWVGQKWQVVAVAIGTLVLSKLTIGLLDILGELSEGMLFAPLK
jgi:hypothetical protein